MFSRKFIDGWDPRPGMFLNGALGGANRGGVALIPSWQTRPSLSCHALRFGGIHGFDAG